MTIKKIISSVCLGVDTGGTFTDFVLFDGEQVRVHKVLSTPSAPEQAILQGIKDLGLNGSQYQLIHGSTVATNAVLEGKGVRTAYITNRGFADVLQIGRQARRELYNLQPAAKKPLVVSADCYELDTRLSAQGELIKPLSDVELATMIEQLQANLPGAVAINLLFSFLDDAQEKQIEAALPDDLYISCSSKILPEYKEYERGMATVLNAYVGPLMQGYLQRLEKAVDGASSIAVMQSAGGTIGAKQAGQHAVNLLLSGPAGGLKGAQYVAGLSHYKQLLTFDMGGTSTDVALIDGNIVLTSEGHIGHYPVAVPMVDMHTIGAGGGSIARIDAGGLLLVGPESAGADPGPACYGQGGDLATVTDANLVLGRLQPQAFLGGEMTLDVAAARDAIKPLADKMALSIEQAAEGIIRVANEHMVRALQVMSVQRGTDPGDFSLVSFGGAGGLHVCALAEALQIKQAIVPVQGGVLSALGMLVAVPSREMSRTCTLLLDDAQPASLQLSFDELRQQALDDMGDELAGQTAEVNYSVDCRYQGQSFTLNIAWQDIDKIAQAFHQLHEQRYGHALDIPVELVTLRVSVRGQLSSFSLPEIDKAENDKQGRQHNVRLVGVNEEVVVYQREQLGAGQKIIGPALIVETISTSYLAPGWSCRVDQSGNLLLSY
ncbi:MAG: hydantoinase/oxoprolinase family protein [Gammaproteobacteria bacterium]|nr:hydantoinase/oxoprolinase family protein [Gammaproteobacteria bacterium]